MTDLQECRQKIDKIDDEIVKLVEERMNRKEGSGSGKRAGKAGRNQKKGTWRV